MSFPMDKIPNILRKYEVDRNSLPRYCVKPNSGVVDPRDEIAIAVSLQPFEYDPAVKNNHKFMVHSMFAPDGEINQDTLVKDAFLQSF